MIFDLNQLKHEYLAYKEHMAISRFTGVLIAILMVVISMNLGASAGVATCAPQQHFSVGGHFLDEDAPGAGHKDWSGEDCCLGYSCFSTVVLAEAWAVVTPHLSIRLFDSGISAFLSGRLIPPETGPPKLLA